MSLFLRATYLVRQSDRVNQTVAFSRVCGRVTGHTIDCFLLYFSSRPVTTHFPPPSLALALASPQSGLPLVPHPRGPTLAMRCPPRLGLVHRLFQVGGGHGLAAVRADIISYHLPGRTTKLRRTLRHHQPHRQGHHPTGLFLWLQEPAMQQVAFSTLQFLPLWPLTAMGHIRGLGGSLVQFLQEGDEARNR